MISVLRVEVRWHMVEPIDCDTNSVKTADLGHGKMVFYLVPIVKSGVEDRRGQGLIVFRYQPTCVSKEIRELDGARRRYEGKIRE